MSEPYNGMPATGLGDINWLKSRHSNPSGNCVEVACLPGGEVRVASMLPDTLCKCKAQCTFI